MKYVRDSSYYEEVIKEVKYSFGELFLFQGFVVAEIYEGQTINWQNAELMVDDVVNLLGTDGSDIIYISNRVNTYSVIASDWLKFFKYSYSLKSYYVVSTNNVGTLNSTIEKLFFKKKIKHFNCLDEAISEAKKLLQEKVK